MSDETTYDDMAAEMQAAIEEEQAFLKPEPEPEPEPSSETDETTQEPAVVDATKYENLQKALNESRFESRQFKRELAEVKELLRGLAPAQRREVEDQPGIDVDTDPIGALKFMVSKFQETEAQRAEREREEAEQQSYVSTVNKVTDFMIEGENTFRSEAPDYDDAAKYLVESRILELRAFGIDEAAIAETVKNEYLGFAAQMMTEGRNPAPLIYAQARARGFTGAPVDVPREPQQGGAAQAKLEAMKRAAASPSAPKAGSGTSKGEVTEAMLANAKGADFNRLWAQFEKQMSE